MMPQTQRARHEDERDPLKAPDGFEWCAGCDGFGWRMVPNIKAPWHEERGECEECEATGVLPIEEDET